MSSPLEIIQNGNKWYVISEKYPMLAKAVEVT